MVQYNTIPYSLLVARDDGMDGDCGIIKIPVFVGLYLINFGKLMYKNSNK